MIGRLLGTDALAHTFGEMGTGLRHLNLWYQGYTRYPKQPQENPLMFPSSCTTGGKGTERLRKARRLGLSGKQYRKYSPNLISFIISGTCVDIRLAEPLHLIVPRTREPRGLRTRRLHIDKAVGRRQTVLDNLAETVAHGFYIQRRFASRVEHQELQDSGHGDEELGNHKKDRHTTSVRTPLGQHPRRRHRRQGRKHRFRSRRFHRLPNRQNAPHRRAQQV